MANAPKSSETLAAGRRVVRFAIEAARECFIHRIEGVSISASGLCGPLDGAAAGSAAAPSARSVA
jgi:hypothetical protein